MLPSLDTSYQFVRKSYKSAHRIRFFVELVLCPVFEDNMNGREEGQESL